MSRYMAKWDVTEARKGKIVVVSPHSNYKGVIFEELNEEQIGTLWKILIEAGFMEWEESKGEKNT